MKKLRTDTYELTIFYHVDAKDTSKMHAISHEQYVTRMDILKCALRSNALMHSVINTYELPSFMTCDDDERIVISDQFLMPGNVMVQLSHTSQTGHEYLTTVRTSVSEPKYISDLVDILGGKKVKSSAEKPDPGQAFRDYLRQI